MLLGLVSAVTVQYICHALLKQSVNEYGGFKAMENGALLSLFKQYAP